MTSLESSFQGGDHSKLSIIVDTSQKDGRLLVADQNYQIVFSSHWKHPSRHTEQLILEFKKSKFLFAKKNPSAIYFISGPGSFTGLRVGAAFVKSLALIFKSTPIYCINSFRLTAIHALKQLEESENFSVCISSVGSMAFRADYEVVNQMFHKETVHRSGAKDYTPLSNKVFSPNSELCKKFSDITQVVLGVQDYISAIKELDQDKEVSKIHTHLDLYPLYLRKSEAEEKYRYDKAKL